MTSRIHCPYCGKKKHEVSRSVKKCLFCGKPLPACRECGSRNVGFIGVDLLGCFDCKTEFPPPGPLRNKGKEEDSYWWRVYWDLSEEDRVLEEVTETEGEFAWVTDFAIQLNPRIPRVLLYDPMNRNQQGLSNDPELSYLKNIQKALHVVPLLELRRDFLKAKSPAAMFSFTKDLPAAEWFADKVVARPGGIKHPEGEERLRWGTVIREEFEKSLMVEDQAPAPPPNWRKRKSHSTKETAVILGCSVRSCFRYLDKGWLKQTKHKRITTESIIEFLENPPPESLSKKS